MAFPLTPTNGQTSTINGVTYTYTASTNSWARSSVNLPTFSIITDTFTSNGSTVSFVLSITPASKELITVNIDGVLQQKTAYDIAGNTLILTGTPTLGAVIEVKIINAVPSSVLTGLVFDSFVGDNSTTAFTLSTTPTSKNFTIVTVGGVVQQKINYTVTSSTLTFSTAPPLNAPIEVTTFGPAITTVSTTAAGSSNQVQVNANGILTGYSNLTFDNSTTTLATGNVTANIINANAVNATTFTGTTITGNVVGNVSGSAATVTTAAQPNITSLGTLTGLTVTGTTTLQLASDLLAVKTGATGVVTHDLTSSGVFYHTSPAANFTANFTNVPVTDNRVLTVTLLINQGSTPYIPSAVQLEGAAQTIKWLNASAPTGNASRVDVVSFNFIRTSSSWTVMGSLTSYA